jgi:sulfur-oxidizing protein SoxY
MRSPRIAPAVAAMILVMASAHPARTQTTPEESQKIWQELKPEIFKDRAIGADEGVVTLEVPKRAQDAGLVPVDIAVDPARSMGGVKAVTLVIDANPSPLAAVFSLGQDAGVRHISTRVRVNDYSFVRAIAETRDGKLHMIEKFVKASGGCSAPAVKSPTEAKATMGVMKLRQFAGEAPNASSAPHELQLMIRHPNNSGYQMDQITRNFIPPHFVKSLKVTQGGKDIFGMEGGISISEDPNFRFDYLPNGAKEIEAVAIDTQGKTFKSAWPVEAAVETQ